MTTRSPKPTPRRRRRQDVDGRRRRGRQPLKGKRAKAKDATGDGPGGNICVAAHCRCYSLRHLRFRASSAGSSGRRTRSNEAGEQAQQAAINYAEVLTSIDSNNVDQNFRQVLDGATGEFKDMYTQSSVQLRQLLIDNKATAHGVVVDSAIASESTGKVVVLIFIDQTVTNMAAPDPRIDRSRIKMTMEKIDGRWRASKVQLL